MIPSSKSVTEIARVVVCTECGATFGCSLSDRCWCMESDVRLPAPLGEEADCLCEDCLRKAARRHALPAG